MEIIEKIRLLRESQSISQEGIAHALDMSQKSYSRIESGDTSLKVYHLEQIAKILKIKPGKLLDAEGVEVMIKIENQTTENIYGTQNGMIQKYYSHDNSNLQERLEKVEDVLKALKKP